MLKVSRRPSLTDTFSLCLQTANTLHKGSHGRDTQAPAQPISIPHFPPENQTNIPTSLVKVLQSALSPHSPNQQQKDLKAGRHHSLEFLPCQWPLNLLTRGLLDLPPHLNPFSIDSRRGSHSEPGPESDVHFGACSLGFPLRAAPPGHNSCIALDHHR